MPPKRRHRGEDSTYRVCADKWGCPAVDPETRKRPEHGKQCRAPWAYSIDEGIVGGKRVRRVVTARSKVALMAKVEDLKAKRIMGVNPSAQTVGDWLDFWVDRVAPANGVRPRTLRGYRGYIDQYLKPSLGRVKLQDLTADHVEALEDWMRTLDKSRRPGNGSGPLSDSTIRQAIMVLRSALKDALSRRKVTYNAAAVVRAPRASSNPHDHLELADAKRVIDANPDPRMKCRLVVALALGLRQGEALALRWVDYRIDGQGAYLMVMESVQRIEGRLTRADVKSRASHRVLPIPAAMMLVFENWRAAATTGEAYIFPGKNGGPCDAKADWSDWSAALERAGVRHVPLHGARGSAASLLADAGEPDWRIAEVLGQATVAVTRRHYIRGTDASHRTAIETLSGELLTGPS